jgi:putative SOS response-associated peptidase YedK
VCGRYVQTSPADALAARFGARLPEGLAWTPRWNVAPSALAPLVRDDTDGPALALLSWGLLPSWAKEEGGLRPINARAEGIAGKPMFRDALKRRRALVPADGFYEWKAESAGKTPWLFRLAGGSPFAFAGLWERRAAPPGAAPFESFAIVTTAANDLVSPVHARMPVILDAETEALWTRPGPLTPAELERCLRPFDAGAMEAWPVSSWVNVPAHEGPRCVEPSR